MVLFLIYLVSQLCILNEMSERHVFYMYAMYFKWKYLFQMIHSLISSEIYERFIFFNKMNEILMIETGRVFVDLSPAPR